MQMTPAKPPTHARQASLERRPIGANSSGCSELGDPAAQQAVDADDLGVGPPPHKCVMGVKRKALPDR
jgi:hypothetical protein